MKLDEVEVWVVEFVVDCLIVIFIYEIYFIFFIERDCCKLFEMVIEMFI